MGRLLRYGRGGPPSSLPSKEVPTQGVPCVFFGIAVDRGEVERIPIEGATQIYNGAHPLLREEFDLMVSKGQWVVFLYSVAKELPGLRLILLLLKDERDWHMWWLGHYRISNINCKTLPKSALYAMQYDRALERIIRDIDIDNPALGLVHVLKGDVRAGL